MDGSLLREARRAHPWNPVDSSEDDDYPGDAPSESESVHEQALDNIPNLSENHFGIEAPEERR